MNKFVGFLETAGKAFEKGLGFVVKDAPELTGLATLVFGPGAVAVAAPATLALTLLQNSILLIEQKYAAQKQQDGTGTQKAADVITLAGPSAIALLNQAGVPAADNTFIGDLIKILVGLLNLKLPSVTADETVKDAIAA
jgi:hypothetical protein